MVAKLKLLNEKQITKELAKLESFTVDKTHKKLSAVFSFRTHIDALVFIARITVHAEIQNHHPDITFTYAKVKVVLTTHEVKGLTQKDIALARKIESLEKSRG